MQNEDVKIKNASESECEGRTIIFVNPHSGRGTSTIIFQTQLLPLLESRKIKHQLVVSNQQACFTKFIQNLTTNEINQLKSIIVISGDGALHEIINALMSHRDHNLAIKVPIGIIPTGSGNGLAYTLIRQKYPNIESKIEAVKICCQAALQDESCESDLVKVSFGENSNVWSFLSIGWGLLADIDIDSEWLRCLGEFRFTVYGLLKSIRYRAYAGKLSFKRAENKDLDKVKKSEFSDWRDSSKVDENQDDWIHIEDNFSCLYAVYQSHVSSVTKFAPKSTLNDRLIYLTYITGKLSPRKAIKFLLRIKDGSHETLPFVTVVPVTTFKFQPLERCKVVVDGEVIAWDQSQGPLTAGIAPELMRLLWA